MPVKLELSYRPSRKWWEISLVFRWKDALLINVYRTVATVYVDGSKSKALEIRDMIIRGENPSKLLDHPIDNPKAFGFND